LFVTTDHTTVTIVNFLKLQQLFVIILFRLLWTETHSW